MPLSECMRTHTRTELRIWLEWLNLQYHRPSRSDHYLMQIACEVRRVLAKNPNSLKLDNFKVEFREVVGKAGEKSGLSREEYRQAVIDASKARWRAIIQGKKKDPPKSK